MTMTQIWMLVIVVAMVVFIILQEVWRKKYRGGDIDETAVSKKDGNAPQDSK